MHELLEEDRAGRVGRDDGHGAGRDAARRDRFFHLSGDVDVAGGASVRLQLESGLEDGHRGSSRS
ncbi:hypothetical protein ACFPRL_21340 [Pseudoclavibacter helvolus]